MKSLFITLCFVLFTVSTVFSQDTTTQKVVVVERPPADYMSVRAGVWWPKDTELQYEGQTYESAKAEVDRSQAIGLDFHYRRGAQHILSTDLALGFWYSSYSFNYKDILSAPKLVREASSWAVVIPLTIGVSLNILPGNIISPFGSAGIGLYSAVTGTKLTKINTGNEEDTKAYFAFGGFVGLGVDIFLNPDFAISAAGKYHLAKFKENLFTQQKDFSGVQLQLGITSKY